MIRLEKSVVDMSNYLREENNLDNQNNPDSENKIDIPSIVLTVILITMCIIIPFSIKSKKVEDNWNYSINNSINKSTVENAYNVIEYNSDSDVQDKKKLPLETETGLKFSVDRKRSDDISDLSNFIVINYGYSDIEVTTSDGDTLYSSYDERYSGYINESGSHKNISVPKIDNLARKDNFKVIKIPSEYKGRYLEITLNPIKDSDTGIVTNIYNVNNPAELMTVIFLKEVHLVIPSVIMIIVGLIGILVYTIRRLYKKQYISILYLTELAGLTGLMLLCQTDFLKAIFPSKLNTIYYMLYISSQLINVPIINYITTRFGHTLEYKDTDINRSQPNKWNKVVSISGQVLIVLTILNSIIQFILSINGYIAYIDTILISVTLTVLTSFVFVLTCVINRDKLSKFEKIFYALIYIMNALSMINSTYLKFHIFNYVLSAETILFIIFLISVALKYFETIEKERIHFSFMDEALRTDNLTKLGSRYAYESKLFDLNKSNNKCVIMFVDLNNLKFINDKLGHKSGDKAIKGVAEYLKEKFRGSDIFRIGGDEFVLIFEYYIDYEKLSKYKSEEVYVEGVTEHIPVVMSFGVSFYDPNNPNNETVEDYIKHADRAMYINKQKYKRKYPQWSYRILN